MTDRAELDPSDARRAEQDRAAQDRAAQDRAEQDRAAQDRPRCTAPDQEALREALNRYLTARRAQRRAHPGTADGEVAGARAALVHLLEQAGWEPPPSVRAALDADAPLLRAADRRSA